MFTDECVKATWNTSTSEEILVTKNYLKPRGIDTLVTPMVDTNWPEPNKGYYMFLDQNTAYMGKTYYDEDAFKTIKENYVNTATAVVSRFAKAQGISKDPSELKEGIRSLIEFEQRLVLAYSTSDEIRREYKRSWNPKSIAELADYKFVDWKDTYFQQVAHL
ncbi:unnamed protein product [Cylicostephanus goldi]|uniref:Peptidase M13 N-terminal domain-containing protein n=1 Tax=Cylicostephanus goldi TaxID=71465 RepID=A0A3P6RYA6_CYLGO|nr:unnamed protein product [Cylicostephanus goldi]